MRTIAEMGENELAHAATVAEPAVTAATGGAPPSRGANEALELSMRSTVLPRLVRVGERVEHSSGGQRFVPVRTI